MTQPADGQPSWNPPLLVRLAKPTVVVLLLLAFAATVLEAARLLVHGQGKVQPLAAIDAAPTTSVSQSDPVALLVRPSQARSSVASKQPVTAAVKSTDRTEVRSSSLNRPAVSTATATFDGRPIRPVHQLTMLVTAYSPDERSCGESADGITASGYSVWTNGMKMAAADKRLLAFGSLVSVDGYHQGKPVPVLDRGGAIKGHHIDLLMPTDAMARRWGKRTMTVTIWDYAD